MTEHPLVAALREAHAALDRVMVDDGLWRNRRWMSMDDMSGAELTELLALESSLEGRLAGLKLQTVVQGERIAVADDAAMTNTPAWAAKAAKNRSRHWSGLWLASRLDEKYHHVRAALASGRLSEEHAVIIVKAAEQVPEDVSAEDLAECEQTLAQKAEFMSPQKLRRAARRLLEPLSKRAADEHEQKLLEDEERHAHHAPSFWMEDMGDGTWQGRFRVPELQAALLQSVLEKLSGPRRWANPYLRDSKDPETARLAESMPPTKHDERLGTAFCEVLEHLPTVGHLRSGIQLVVHVEENDLRDHVGGATIETGARISISEARRLACEAGILPLVLGGKSQPLDLGTSQRLFTRAQYLALSAKHETCAAEGCDRPFSWCELHHKLPWSHGGPTDIANAAPLCGFHHRKVHDAKWRHEWLPDGTLRLTSPGRMERQRAEAMWKRGATSAA